MTGKELAQALRCCAKGLGHDDACENCKVGEIQDRREYIEFAAANAIERLTAENAALLGYVKLFAGCDMCRHSNYCKTDCPCDECEQDVKGNCYCKDCERGSNWEWRGLPEAPEEGGKHE